MGTIRSKEGEKIMSKIETWQKATIMLIFSLIILGVFKTSISVSAEDSVIIAAWNYTEAPTDYPVKATSGFYGAKAFLEDFKISYKTPSYLNDGLSLRGWDKGADAKFWQVSFSTKAYRNLSLSAKTSSSSPGPRDFKIIYSVDNGVTWNEVPGSSYQIAGYTKLGQDVVYRHNINLSLPVEVDNRDKLLLRFIMRTNFPAQTYYGYNYGDVASDGTSQINNIIVSGTPMVTGISLNTSEETINKEETLKLTALIEPENAGNKQVEWTTSNSQVAEVEDGVVKGVGSGTAIITAKTVEGEFEAACRVTVEVPVKGITFERTIETLIVDSKLQLTPKIDPENATNKDISWESSNKQIVDVDEKGCITALSAGTAEIIAKTLDGGFEDKCIITVTVPVTRVSLEKTEVTIRLGDEPVKLNAAVYPEDATNRNIQWTSSNSQVVTVEDGVITAKDGGTADITAATVDGGFKASCTITVIIPVTGIQTEDEYVTVNPGGTIQLKAIILPEKASNKKVIWKSSDRSIATVDDYGWVKGIRNGVVKITATTVDGNFNAEYIVAVAEKPVAGIRLNKEEITIEAGKFEMITAHLFQGNVSVSDLIWSSSNESIAKVGSIKDNGKTAQILGLVQGEAIITVTALDGGFTARCKVKIIASQNGKK